MIKDFHRDRKFIICKIQKSINKPISGHWFLSAPSENVKKHLFQNFDLSKQGQLDLNSALDSINTVRDLSRKHWFRSLVFDSICVCIHVQNAYPTPPDGKLSLSSFFFCFCFCFVFVILEEIVCSFLNFLFDIISSNMYLRYRTQFWQKEKKKKKKIGCK